MRAVQHKHQYQCWNCGQVNEFYSPSRPTGQTRFGGRGHLPQRAAGPPSQLIVYNLNCGCCGMPNHVVLPS